jgi:hypothetical protein
VREEQSKSREAIAVLNNEAANTTRQIHQLDSKLEDMPEKIVRLIDRQKS